MKPAFNKNKIAKVSLLASSVLLSSMPAHSFEFFFDIEGSFDSQFSVGSSWRVEKQDDALLLPGNNNDGNANFEKGDAFSQIFKGSHDLHIRSENHGVFIRGQYWHDYALEENKVLSGHSSNGYMTDEKLDDKNFNAFSKFSGASLMDAYIYGAYEIGYTPLDIRLGRQVVSWGESTFIFGGGSAKPTTR